MSLTEAQRGYLNYRKEFYVFEGDLPKSVHTAVGELLNSITLDGRWIPLVDKMDMIEVAALKLFAERKCRKAELALCDAKQERLLKSLSIPSLTKEELATIMSRLEISLSALDDLQLSLVSADLDYRNDEEVKTSLA